MFCLASLPSRNRSRFSQCPIHLLVFLEPMMVLIMPISEGTGNHLSTTTTPPFRFWISCTCSCEWPNIDIVDSTDLMARILITARTSAPQSFLMLMIGEWHHESSHMSPLPELPSNNLVRPYIRVFDNHWPLHLLWACVLTRWLTGKILLALVKTTVRPAVSVNQYCP